MKTISVPNKRIELFLEHTNGQQLDVPNVSFIEEFKDRLDIWELAINRFIEESFSRGFELDLYRVKIRKIEVGERLVSEHIP